MRIFLQTQMVQAQPAVHPTQGPGYEVLTANHGVDFWPEELFELHHRVVSRKERQLVSMNIAEAEVAAISDPKPV